MKNRKKFKIDWDKYDSYIIKNAESTWTEFKKEFQNFEGTDAAYYARKHKLLDKKSTKSTEHKKIKCFYKTIDSIPETEISKDEIKGMIRLAEILKHDNCKIRISKVTELKMNDDNTMQETSGIEIQSFTNRL